MALFDYTGRNSNGQSVQGQIDAVDASAAAKLLIQRNLVPINIVQGQAGSVGGDDSIGFWVAAVKLPDLVIFARQMYSLTKAGIPILRAVNGLADSTNSKRMEVALRDVCVQLEKGRTLSSALNAHPTIFNQLFVSIVHVGENTGRLDDAFNQLAGYLEREQETRKQIKAATRYPMFVIIAIIAALFALNILVIPTFASVFERLGSNLPLMTQILIGMSEFFVAYWPQMLVTILASAFAFNRYINSTNGRLRWDRLLLKMPIIGGVIERTVLGRFSRSFAMMLNAGVPMTNALTLVADAVGNRFMAARIVEMRRNIERGENLSRVAKNSEMFTPLVLQMIGVGEETGRIDELLLESAEYYEREVDYDVRSLTAKIEPVLIVVVAGMVLVLALGIFTPMWDLMGAYRGR